MPYYLTALCIDQQGQTALLELEQFVENVEIDSANKRAEIMANVNNELWTECSRKSES